MIGIKTTIMTINHHPPISASNITMPLVEKAKIYSLRFSKNFIGSCSLYALASLKLSSTRPQNAKQTILITAFLAVGCVMSVLFDKDFQSADLIKWRKRVVKKHLIEKGFFTPLPAIAKTGDSIESVMFMEDGSFIEKGGMQRIFNEIEELHALILLMDFAARQGKLKIFGLTNENLQLIHFGRKVYGFYSYHKSIFVRSDISEIITNQVILHEATHLCLNLLSFSPNKDPKLGFIIKEIRENCLSSSKDLISNVFNANHENEWPSEILSCASEYMATNPKEFSQRYPQLYDYYLNVFNLKIRNYLNTPHPNINSL